MIRLRRICHPLTVEGGFTLLEVLVASAVLGAALTLLIGAWNGLGRTRDVSVQHEWAQQIAMQKLAEFSAEGVTEFAKDDTLMYHGVEFGYKLSYTPVKDADWLPQKLGSQRRLLYRVQLDIYWGKSTADTPGLSVVTHLFKMALS